MLQADAEYFFFTHALDNLMEGLEGIHPDEIRREARSRMDLIAQGIRPKKVYVIQHVKEEWEEEEGEAGLEIHGLSIQGRPSCSFR